MVLAEENEPQDLRVKRRKESDPAHDVLRKGNPEETRLVPETSDNTYSAAASESRIPSITSFAPFPSYSPPPSGAAVGQNGFQQQRESRFPPLADFYLQLFQQSTTYHQKKRGSAFSSWDSMWPLGAPSAGVWSPFPQSISQVVPPTGVEPLFSLHSHLVT